MLLLTGISEMLVLFVSQICRLKLMEFGLSDISSIQLVSTSVLSNIDKPNGHGDDDSQAEKDDNDDFGGGISRSIGCSESLGPQKITQTVSNQQNGIDCDFLGMSSSIGGDQRKHTNQTNGIQTR